MTDWRQEQSPPSSTFDVFTSAASAAAAASLSMTLFQTPFDASRFVGPSKIRVDK
jgi:hypothetical protein